MNKQPVHQIRFGLILARIWKNNTRNGDRYKVTVCRLYRNGDVWKESTQFWRDDLPNVVKVADLAHTWIYVQGSNSEEAGEAKD
ncbi:MAG: hypothetical protein ACE361_26185 [Aureliella sp.]